MRYKVFVSYSRRDEHLVQPLAALLGAATGDAVFLDVTSIRPGQIWSNKIETALHQARVFIVCWCCHSRRSAAVAQEIWNAINLGARKRLVPVLFCSAPLPESLAPLQWIDMRGHIAHKCEVRGHDELQRQTWNTRPLFRLPTFSSLGMCGRFVVSLVALASLFLTSILLHEQWDQIGSLTRLSAFTVLAAVGLFLVGCFVRAARRKNSIERLTATSYDSAELEEADRLANLARAYFEGIVNRR